jgi:hypothetical protein
MSINIEDNLDNIEDNLDNIEENLDNNIEDNLDNDTEDILNKKYNDYLKLYNEYKLSLDIIFKQNIESKQLNKCSIENCSDLGTYNFLNKFTKNVCKKHKLNNMIYFGRKRCSDIYCLKHPSFNYKFINYPKYCYDHRLLNMVNVINKRCKTYLCDLIVGNKYDGYCLYCFSNMFPDKCINYKTKERHIVEFVKEFFPLSWIIDKKIYDGCSLGRPDLFLDLGYQIIIVEVDENQHISYDNICENKRIMLLSQDLNHRPIVFIRFNPDNYIKDGIIINSPWTNTPKKGLIKIKNYNDWNIRLKTLEKEITFWINPDNQINKTIHVVELFFDS